VTSTKTILLGEQQASIELQKLGGTVATARTARNSAASTSVRTSGMDVPTGYVAGDPTPFRTVDLCEELF
jgi:hypothetical protein